MSTKKTQFEAAATDRFAVVAQAPGRKRVYLYNDTARIVRVSLGPEAGRPLVSAVLDATFASFVLAAGVIWESPPGQAEDEIHAYFSATEAAKFLRVTEVF